MPKAVEPHVGIVVALDAFVAAIDGEPFDVRRGDHFEDDHPLVVKHPQLFRPLRFRYPVAQRVERATAAPGEKRE